MRDIALFALIFGALPFVLRQPAIGVLLWVWISLMNPHRQAWGAAYSFPFAYVVALVTFAGLLFTREPRRMKGGAVAVVLLLFVGWMVVSTLFALRPEAALEQLERILKIQLFTFIALLVFYKRQHVTWLMAVLTVSIGFYAIKGGVFTITTLGSYRVWGPQDSFFFDNNAAGLAFVMTIPLWVYLRMIAARAWMRHAAMLAIVLSAFAIVGTHSRGALLATLAMAGFLWIRVKNKALALVGLVLLGSALLAFAPEAWEERMRSIFEYQEDGSAMGRINTWIMLLNIALERPLVGGGFELYSVDVLARYNPAYGKVHSAHSIYFQVLGELGFVGLALFLLFWTLTWRLASKIVRATQGRPDEAWAHWLARMIQVSLVGYFTGGAFLNMAYWDAPYFLMVALVITESVLREKSKDGAPAAAAASRTGANSMGVGGASVSR